MRGGGKRNVIASQVESSFHFGAQCRNPSRREYGRDHNETYSRAGVALEDDDMVLRRERKREEARTKIMIVPGPPTELRGRGRSFRTHLQQSAWRARLE